MIQVAISPSTLLDESIGVENVEGIRLFKCTETFQRKLDVLLEKNETGGLSSEELQELHNLTELE